MNKLVLLTLMLCGIHAASAASHSLRYFVTAVTASIDFPEYSDVGLLDDELFTHYDSNIRRAIPKSEWIKKNVGADYWDRETQLSLGHQQAFKANIGIAMLRFNQTQGVHTVQWMYGCEWDDETGATGGFDQYGYDGEDFITYDMRNQRFIAPTPQAFITAVKWNNDPALLESLKQYLTQECVDWLQKYVSYGRSALERTVAPKVSLLQKDPSSPVTCHVTGFYPRGVMVTWERNGKDLYEDVELGETVPNDDGTFQTRSHLTVKPEDWKGQEYTCTVQHKSLKQYIVLPVKEENIKRNSDIKTSHSLKYFYTAVTAGIDFPEFTVVGLVDDEQFVHYDSNIRRMIPKTEWIKENMGADYWDRETQLSLGHQQAFKANIGIAMLRFNQTQGVHTVQWMYGCERDDETGATGGFDQYGYDGEDLVTYDMRNQRFIAPVQQAFITAQKWNNDPAQLESLKQYLTHTCVDWLKKYVSYGRSALERTVAPKVSLLQKDPSSPVTCHVTGFYPRGVMVTWERNGKDVDEDVELGETVPNGDGTFQTTSHLRVKPEDWKSQEYTCTVQHKSLKQDIVLPVKEENIKRNSDIKSYKTTNTSDTGSEGSDQPAVKA